MKKIRLNFKIKIFLRIFCHNIILGNYYYFMEKDRDIFRYASNKYIFFGDEFNIEFIKNIFPIYFIYLEIKYLHKYQIRKF